MLTACRIENILIEFILFIMLANLPFESVPGIIQDREPSLVSLYTFTSVIEVEG